MPTLAISTALLILGNTEGLPWTSSTWQENTKVYGLPWEIVPHSAPEKPTPNVTSWTTQMAQTVEAYARNLWLSDDRYKYSTSSSDNNSAGRSRWNNWVKKNWTRWNMNNRIDQVFIEHKCSPYEVMVRNKKNPRKLPTLENSQVSNVILHPLVHALLGESAFEEDDNMFLVQEVKEFLDTLIVQTWQRYRKAVNRDTNMLEKGQEELEDKWTNITREGASPTMETIRPYLKLLQKSITVLTRYKDTTSLKQLQDYRDKLDAMLAVSQDDETKWEEAEKLPKVLKDALKKLASEKDVQEVQQLIQIALENLEGEDENFCVELPEGPGLDFAWKEGTESLSGLSEEQLWCGLGLKDKKLPFFQEYADPDGIIEPWSDEGEKWLASESNTRDLVQPRWHQLVGIYRMLERAFDGEPVLLMDGVGIGKTFQVIAFIACLAYYRHYFEQKNRFPGSFGDKKWQGKQGNIPSNPFVIVCPVNLHHQWSREIERFLKRGTFDLFPYTGKLSGRKNWWTEIFTQSRHENCHRIVLATESALQDDASNLFMDMIRKVGDQPQKTTYYSSRVSTTLYNHQYLAFIMDEAHTARKLNKLHCAAYALRAKSYSMIAMTATPVLTKLQDLWIMGHLLGIAAFAEKAEFVQMTRELNRAQARDRKAERESENGAEHLRKLLAGSEAHDPKKTELYPKLQKYIPILRSLFSGNVIRRSLDSVDAEGNKISGMAPYLEHVMLLELREWEKKVLTTLTSQLVDETPLTTLVGTGKNFYIEIRRGLLHPGMNPHSTGESWKKPKNLEEWTAIASTKLDILAKIVHHHLNEDNASPLSIREDGQTLHSKSQSDTSAMVQDPDHAECDRIVIFSAFPSSNAAIRDVLALYGVKTVELHGKVTQNKRKSILKEFRSSSRQYGPRVLILSMVGAVGLNLACANIMIIADTLWSALDDEQLRGRIYRFPQKKQVHFYRLVARGTPDVFLNNIAFDKGLLHLAFVGMDDNTLSLFQGKSELSPVAGSDSDDSDSEENRKDTARKHAGRTNISTSKKSSGPSVGTSRKRGAPASPPKRSEATKKARKGKAREMPQPSVPAKDMPLDSTVVLDTLSITVSSSPIIPNTSPLTSQSQLPSPFTHPGSSPPISSPQSSSPSYSSLFGGHNASDEGDIWNGADVNHLVQVMERDHGSLNLPRLEDMEDLNLGDIHFSPPLLDPPPRFPSSSQGNSSSSPPSQGLSLPKTKASINPGVRARQPTRQSRMENPSSSSHHSETIEEIGGTPLIPSAMGRFKSVPVKRGKGKQRR